LQFGTAHVAWRGTPALTADLRLSIRQSLTGDGSAVLVYAGGGAQLRIGALTAAGSARTAAGREVFLRAPRVQLVSASGECGIEVSRFDPAGVSGTVECPSLSVAFLATT
jgi:hypothetical protein